MGDDTCGTEDETRVWGDQAYRPQRFLSRGAGEPDSVPLP
jgi:hypothetical protein